VTEATVRDDALLRQSGRALLVSIHGAQRSLKLWLIDGGYHTLQFTLYGLIIGLWLIFAVAAPTGAGTLAVDAAKGLGELAVGLGKIISTF